MNDLLPTPAEESYLRALLVRLGVRPQDIDDCVQEIWLRTLVTLKESDIRRPAAWRRRVATNIARDLHRRAYRRRSFPLDDGRHRSPEPDPVLAVGERDWNDIVRAAVDALPPELRDTVRGDALALTHADLSRLRAVCTKTVSRRRSRALSSLRSALQCENSRH